MIRCGSFAAAWWADTVEAAIPTASAARRATRRCFTTNPPSARGSVCRRATGLLTRGSPSAAFPAVEASGVVAEGISPHSGGARPGLSPGCLPARRYVRRAYHRRVPVATAVAVDLDGALGDTRPLWEAWLEDAARRLRTPELVDLPA